MSDLTKPNEARDWVNSYMHETSPGLCYRTIARVAVEQRANYDACRSNRRWPGSIREESYRESVELLEAAVEPAKRRWEAYEAEHERKAQETRAKEAEELKRIKAQYPNARRGGW